MAGRTLGGKAAELSGSSDPVWQQSSWRTRPGGYGEGIPDDAFTAVTGDDKKVASAFKKRNKLERTSKQRGFSFEADDHSERLCKSEARIDGHFGGQCCRRASEGRAVRQMAGRDAASLTMRLWLDLWTAQFFTCFTAIDDPAICTTGPFLDFAKDAAKQPQKSRARHKP